MCLFATLVVPGAVNYLLTCTRREWTLKTCKKGKPHFGAFAFISWCTDGLIKPLSMHRSCNKLAVQVDNNEWYVLPPPALRSRPITRAVRTPLLATTYQLIDIYIDAFPKMAPIRLVSARTFALIVRPYVLTSTVSFTHTQS